MDIIQELLQEIPLPRMVKIRQEFIAAEVVDVAGSLQQELVASNVLEQIKPGMSIAIAVGSRGVAEIPTLTRVVVEEIKKHGGRPFLVPSMGSHGGANAEGQKEVLENLGITETVVGCPIRSSMEVVEIGCLENGLPVYIDKFASQADGIVVINRIKPHTAFRGNNESGICKMITIGLGKQKGAESCHAYSFKYMAENILEMAQIALCRMPILFAVGTVENAYDKVAKIVVAPKDEIIEIDRQLLIEAKANMPRIYFDQIDVLIIDRIGKDISGDGMDPNITGRYPTPYASGGPNVSKMVVLDLTERTHGNANGMGTADFTTQKLVDKVNFKMTYANGLTSTVVGPTHMPMVLDTDRDAIRAAIKTCNALDLSKARVVRIKDTLHLGEIWISEELMEEAEKNSSITILSELQEMSFNSAGKLKDLE
ncbi:MULTISPECIES: lactate racemase domain-containing protein [Pelosinus]|uniref:LarA-like N-terminal domain-containing protein n=1 Tax=Pelosinus fermentans B4 TaxID=1149862 RepID=I8RJN4_9FIRM|nr:MULTISPECIES: lactate racemase domain-containing protein [Pelosinus]MDF2570397.1 hypothetical protein [Sporomusa sp.]EIW20273.1 Protein of unknown function DUF2088 [Pelosinus fermentans B4]EIW25889.1 iron-sulfur cluster binding protein [Pelosinus fermentans A11]OAM93187.1 Protein of unknown function DUF2088 [Pelosinus fermentans DSM 17108]SDQ69714.1 protein of unknown function [Pelosinus fermentans]